VISANLKIASSCRNQPSGSFVENGAVGNDKGVDIAGDFDTTNESSSTRELSHSLSHETFLAIVFDFFNKCVLR